MNTIIMYFPCEFFQTGTALLEIGIIDNLTIERGSYEFNNSRVFKFDPIIWPAVELIIFRMYKINANSYVAH